MDIFFVEEDLKQSILEEVATDIWEAFNGRQLTIKAVDTHGQTTIIKYAELLDVTVGKDSNDQHFLLTLQTTRGNFMFAGNESPSIMWLGDRTVNLNKARWQLDGPPSIFIAASDVI